MRRSDIATVVIGRNEGARLAPCLQSTRDWRTIYVDSASCDGSADQARAAGVEVIEIDPAAGLSAARGRNAGLDRLSTDSSIRYVQMLDGDCVLEPGWITNAAAALDADPGVGAVIGELRERTPHPSVYAWLCGVEWERPAGPADSFGGIVLLRAAAIGDVGRYSAEMIAGEDIDFAIRLRAAGWRISAIAAPMAVHDSALRHFRQWWRRTMRSGHAFAELHARHRNALPAGLARSRARILFWGGIVPAALLAGLVLAAIHGSPWLMLSGAALLLVVAQILRISLRESQSRGLWRGFRIAFFLSIGKIAEMAGILRYAIGHRRGGQKRLIEYKQR